MALHEENFDGKVYSAFYTDSISFRDALIKSQESVFLQIFNFVNFVEEQGKR